MFITVTNTAGLEPSFTVGSSRALRQPLGLLRLLQLLSTCVAFSLVVHMDAWVGPFGNWCMFTWCFSFAVTLLILILELSRLHTRFLLAWLDFPITCACYGALFCLSSSIIYPVTYVRFMAKGRAQDYAIASTAMSCVACLAYATEVNLTRAKPSKITGYLATVPGLLKIFETAVACVIFVFISNSNMYKREPALKWCVAVYAICFIVTMLIILLNLTNSTKILPISFPKFLSGVALLCVILYITAIILWPLYQFAQKLHGEPDRSKDLSCSNKSSTSVCGWDRRMAVTILTSINLIAYVADGAYSGYWTFFKA